MSLSQKFIVLLFKVILRLICRIDGTELERVPRQGPLIVVTNHTNILDIPIIYTCLQPRLLHGLVLAERWKNRLFGYFLDACETIPLRRGEPDLAALRRATAYLDEGHQVIIMPEGTRSGDGRLQAGLPGVVLLAQHNRTPVQPVVIFGGEKYKDNLAGLKRTDFHIRVGKRFCLESPEGKISRLHRQQAADEIMYQLAALLPERYRGVYADLSAATQQFISWLPDQPAVA